MKKRILLFASIFGIAVHSFAATHTDTVIVSDNSFTPNSVTAHTGDTILWLWADGSNTLASKTIPSGAAAWSSNINSTTTSFMYIPTVAGTYNYESALHAETGTAGSFIVTNSTGISDINGISIIKVYPNPVSTSLHIKFNFQYNSTGLPVSVTITDMNGRRVIKRKYKVFNDADIDLQEIPDGNYILYAKQGNDVYHQQLVIAH